MKFLSASVFIVVAVFCGSAGAATITYYDLPNPIQTCILALDCSFPENSISTVGNADIFALDDGLAPGGADPDTKFLVRYGLAAPSASTANGVYYDFDLGANTPINSNDPYSGYLWLLVNDSYAGASNAHSVELYLDKVLPAGSYFEAEHLSLTFTSADLLAGSGYRKSGYDFTCSTLNEGSLIIDPVPVLLAECPTWYLAELNLVYLTFLQDGGLLNLNPFALNANDNRGLVYSYTNLWENSYEGTGVVSTQTFYTQTPIPLPPAAWLFLTGLAFLWKKARRA